MADQKSSQSFTFYAGSRAALKAMEAAVLSADRTVCMGHRNLDPDTPCLTEEADEAGLETWSDLLYAVAKRGVRIRVLLSDFDPIFTTEEHRNAWRTYRLLRRFDRQLPSPMQIVCSTHPGACNALGSWVALPATLKRAKEVEGELSDTLGAGDSEDRQQDNQAGDAISNVPGLWPYLSQDGAGQPGRTPSLSGLWRHRVVPSSHHEKLLIVDEKHLFIGGVDIEKKRLGIDEFHWHDIHACLEGPVVRQALDHFEDRWRQEFPAFAKRVKELTPPDTVEPLKSPEIRDASSPAISSDAGGSDAAIQKPQAACLLRTRSTRRRGLLVTTPETVTSEIQSAYLEAIGSAETFVYLETQFLRSRVLGQALAARGRECPDLHLAIVLPHLPERALNEETVNKATRHGIHLQNRILDQLAGAFSNRLAIFSVVEFDSGSAGEAMDEDRQIAGKPIAYVHSKLLIVDNTVAILGSANANGRSFLYDTEAAVRILDPAAIRCLWATAAGSLTNDGAPALGTPGDVMLKSLAAVAQRNMSSPAKETEGLSHRAGLVLFNRTASDRLARKSYLVPDDLV